MNNILCTLTLKCLVTIERQETYQQFIRNSSEVGRFTMELVTLITVIPEVFYVELRQAGQVSLLFISLSAN